MVKPGSWAEPPLVAASCTKETVRQVLEPLPPVLMAWRNACQAGFRWGRVFWEKGVFQWVPEFSQHLAGCYALVVHGGSLSCVCWFLWQSRAWIVFNRYHSLTWQIFWKVHCQKSIHHAVLVIVVGKLPDFELGDDDYELGCLKIFADIVDQLNGSGWELTIHCLQITILTLTVWCLALKAWHWWRWDLTWIESSFLEFGIGLGLQLINSKTRKLLHFDWVFTCESCEHHIFVEVWDVSEPKNWNLGCWEHQVSMSRHKAGSFPGRLAKPHFWATLWGSAGFGSSDHHTDAEDIWGGVLQWSCWCFPFWLLRSTSTKILESTDRLLKLLGI